MTWRKKGSPMCDILAPSMRDELSEMASIMAAKTTVAQGSRKLVSIERIMG